jgi:sec-independent protein translocase protein TatA
MALLGFFQNIGATELIIILAIALLIFGPQLPKIARSLGKSVTEFKRGMSDVGEEIYKEPPPESDKKKAEEKQLQG